MKNKNDLSGEDLISKIKKQDNPDNKIVDWISNNITTIGVISIIIGVLLGLYVGGYLMFIGGIINIVEAVQANVISGATIAWNIVRMMMAGLVGWIIALIFIIPGWGMIQPTRLSYSRRSRRR